MPDKTAESVVKAYLSGILSRAGASMVWMLNGTKFYHLPLTVST